MVCFGSEAAASVCSHQSAGSLSVVLTAQFDWLKDKSRAFQHWSTTDRQRVQQLQWASRAVCQKKGSRCNRVTVNVTISWYISMMTSVFPNYTQQYPLAKATGFHSMKGKETAFKSAALLYESQISCVPSHHRLLPQSSLSWPVPSFLSLWQSTGRFLQQATNTSVPQWADHFNTWRDANKAWNHLEFVQLHFSAAAPWTCAVTPPVHHSLSFQSSSSYKHLHRPKVRIKL